jgi:Holliday junction resolvasome RuvABC endonuclease subunit
MVIVGMDPGRHLGICKVAKGAKHLIVPEVTLVTKKLRDTTDLGAFLHSADDPIREALAGADLLAIERPNTAGQHHAGVFKNVALYGHALYWAAHHGVEVLPVNVSAAKLALTDRGNAKKPEMISAAEFQLGLTASSLDEHCADAYAVWLFACYGAPPSAGARAKVAVEKRRIEREAAKAAKLKGALL